MSAAVHRRYLVTGLRSGSKTLPARSQFSRVCFVTPSNSATSPVFRYWTLRGLLNTILPYVRGIKRRGSRANRIKYVKRGGEAGYSLFLASFSVSQCSIDIESRSICLDSTMPISGTISPMLMEKTRLLSLSVSSVF